MTRHQPALPDATIDGFEIFLTPNEDREGVNCFISKGRYSSSLAKAEDYGFIGDEDDVAIRPRTLDRIRAFAEANGY